MVMTIACPRCGAPAGAECRRDGEANTAPHQARIRRAREEADFWSWVDERLADPTCSLTEQELLDSIALPGWSGRKARTAQPRRVIPMPVRDGKLAAAGDYDDAA